MEETDKEFLQWLYDRLVFVYEENPCEDFMQKFEAIIKAMLEKEGNKND